MNLKIFLQAIILYICALTTHAQTIEGKVFDSQTKEPVPGATVQISDSKVGTTTDNNGHFLLNSDHTNVTIKISSIGFSAREIVVSDSKPITIGLEAASENLQSVVVTGNREAALRTESPIAISKLTPRMIDEAKPTAMYEIVNKVPGVMMVNLGNEQHSMAIRQPFTTNSYFLYMEDGVPIRPMGVFNHNSILEFNQFAISSVEVVKGPVSSIYGPEAVGGAINFITQRPTILPTAKIGIQADQWGYQRLQYGAGAMMGKFGVYVGGFTARQRDAWMKSSDYDKNSINARLEYHFSPSTRLIYTLAYSKYDSQTSGSVDSVAFYSRQYVSTTDFTYRKSNSLRSRLTFEKDWKNGSQSFITAFARKNEHGQNPNYGIRWTTGQTTARGEINSSDFKSLGLIAQHSQRFNFLNSKLITGAVFDFSPSSYWSYQVDLAAQLRPDKKSVEKYTIVKERPEIRNSDYDADIKNTAAYAQYDFEILPKLRVSAGVRYDRMSFSYTNFLDSTSGSKSYSKVTPKIGATYDLGKGKGIYANYSRGFSPPGLTSVFRKRTTPLPNGDLFYYNLQPAQFNNAEIGGWASVLNNKIYLDLAFYQMNGRNELLNVRLPDNSYDYQSAGKTLHRGVEFGVTYKPSKEFFFRFGGTSAIHRYEEFILSSRESDALKNVNGKDMPSSPRWMWNSEFSYYPKWFKNFRSSVEWQHVASYYQNQTNTVKCEGYDVLNFRVGYQWKGVEVFSNILNLTDVLYATNATRGNNATDRTTYNAAAPRTVVFGIQYTFTGKKELL
jgi:iron complex outermembrane receptor protein